MTQSQLQEPSAKLLQMGKGALSDNEVLSLIMAGLDAKDKASALLQACEYNYNALTKLSYNELKGFGLSHLQAIRMIAVVEFAKRKGIHHSDELSRVSCSQDIQSLMQPIMGELEHEEFWIILLNRTNKVISKHKISQGGIAGTVIDVRIIYKIAVNQLACGIIICHNHPSGNTQPSEADLRITTKIKEAGALMDIQVLDHIIISGMNYYSFADNGTL